MAKTILEKGESGPVKGFKSKTGREFTAALKLDAEGKVTFSFPDPTPIGVCPACGKPVRNRGKVFKCDTPEGCSFVVFVEMSGRVIQEDDVRTLLTEGRTPVLEGFKDRESNPFPGCLRWTGQRVIVERRDPREDDIAAGPCPRCAADVTFRKGAWSCTACTFRIPGAVASRDMQRPEIVQLLENRRTERLHGFRQSSGAVFKAALVLDADLRVQLDYTKPTDEPPSPVPPHAAFGRRIDCPRCVAHASPDPGWLISGRAAWGCSRWKEGCRFQVPFQVEGFALPEEEALRLFGKSRATRLLNGLGKKRIVLDPLGEPGWKVEG